MRSLRERDAPDGVMHPADVMRTCGACWNATHHGEPSEPHHSERSELHHSEQRELHHLKIGG